MRQVSILSVASLAVAGALAAVLAALHRGLLPPGASAYARPMLIAGAAAVAGSEALRVIHHSRVPGLMRRTRLAFGAGFAALAVLRGAAHVWPTVDGAFVTIFGASAFLMSIASVLDLMEGWRQQRLSSLARCGVGIGATGAALLGVTLVGESRMSWSVWWPPFFIACALLAGAGLIYLRVHGAHTDQSVT